MADVGELAQLIEQYAGTDGIHTTAIPRLILYRASQIEAPMHAVYEPAVCIVAQGRKESIAVQPRVPALIRGAAGSRHRPAQGAMGE